MTHGGHPPENDIVLPGKGFLTGLLQGGKNIPPKLGVGVQTEPRQPHRGALACPSAIPLWPDSMTPQQWRIENYEPFNNLQPGDR